METLYIKNIIGEHSYKMQGLQHIKTLLVSSHPLVLKGISGLLKNESNVELLEHASNKLEMILRIQESNPSLVIINDDEIDTETSITIETIGLVIREFPSIRILFIINNYDFDKELSALKIGVRGILSENFDLSTLLECINTLDKGGLWFRRNVMEKFITEQLFLNKKSGNAPPTLPSLTKRELEIVQLVTSGQKNKEIGEQLFISEKTVKHHLTKVFRKLNIRKRVQLKGM